MSVALNTQPQTMRAVVRNIRFYNPDNGYIVADVEPRDGFETGNPIWDNNPTIVAVGYVLGLREDDEVSLTGTWTEHPKYGSQFKFTKCDILLPQGNGLIAYLASVADGIGPKKAARIVEALGQDCLSKIQQDPGILFKLDFITEEQALQISSDLTQNRVKAELTSLICREGISPRIAAKIYNTYGDKSLQVVKENPYLLADDIWGIGFKKADLIARSVGILPDSPFRLDAAFKYIMREAANEGHVYLRPRDTVEKIKKATSGVFDIPQIAESQKRLAEQNVLVREGDCIYLRRLYEAECRVARDMRRLVGAYWVDLPVTEEQLDSDIDAIARAISQEQNVQIDYSSEQRKAIKLALGSGLSIITGGPGTGKTTVINAIVREYEAIYPHNYIYLAAPTGRAAKRISESTQRDAKTIHRLLEYSYAEGGFRRNAENPLESPGLIILDEFSMCDLELTRDFFDAVGKHQVVLVGDVDQLPSVGPGSVLRDAIASGVIPTVWLTFNHRQARGSKIAEYANMVCRGEVPPLESSGDFQFIEVSGGEEAAEVIVNLVKEVLQEGKTPMDFQILSPQRKGRAGVSVLNEMIREIINPPDKGKPELGPFRLGDKVMVVQNDYSLGVFNGDIGQVVDIEGQTLYVSFFDSDNAEPVGFTGEDLDILQIAYVSTVHKFQGSEVSLVIMPLCQEHYMMLQRNLLYTGMTRARDKLILVAEPRSVKHAVRNDKVAERYSRLTDRLKESI